MGNKFHTIGKMNTDIVCRLDKLATCKTKQHLRTEKMHSSLWNVVAGRFNTMHMPILVSYCPTKHSPPPQPYWKKIGP